MNFLVKMWGYEALKIILIIVVYDLNNYTLLGWGGGGGPCTIKIIYLYIKRNFNTKLYYL
jgi:hypothetical protein